MKAIKFLACVFSLLITQLTNSQNEFWEKVKGPSEEEISCIARDGSGALFAAEDWTGIYRSDNDGNNWSHIAYLGKFYNDLIVGNDGNVYSASRDHISVINESGNTIYHYYIQTDVYSLALNSQFHLYAVTKDSGVVRTTDYGETWENNILFPDSNYRFTSVAIDDFDNIFVGSYMGVFKSIDNGNTWSSKNSGLSELYIFDIMCTSNGYLFLTSNYGISRSTNGGEYWEYMNIGITTNTVIRKIEADESSNLYFGDESSFGKGIIYKSSNWGENWNAVFKTDAGRIISTIGFENKLLIGSEKSGLFKASLTDSTLTSIPIRPIEIRDFSEKQQGEYYTSNRTVRVSTDYGNTWRVIEPTWLLPPTSGLWFEKDSLLFIGAFGQVGLITNKQINYYWDLGINDCGRVSSLVYDPDSTYVIVSTVMSLNCFGGIYKGKLDLSIANWPKINNGIPEHSDITSVKINSIKQLFAGVNLLGIYKSNDFGSSWEVTNEGLTDLSIQIIHIDKEDNIFACTYDKIFRSTDNGESWTYIANYPVKDIVADNENNLYIAQYNQVFKSTDQGSNWTEYGGAFSNFTTRGLFLNDSSYLFVYGFKGIYRSNTPVTNIEESNNFQSHNYHLSQNYPNPFNPVTSIQYAIGSRQFVTLKVYDVLGNEIATLVNEEKQPGTYEVEFNTSSIKHLPSSGIYFYQLRAGNFVESKKMILMK